MAISKELETLIAREMAMILPANILRPGMSYDDFINEYTDILGQAHEDLVLLKNAGLDETKLPKYDAYLEMISLTHGSRVNSDGVQAEAEIDFRKSMPVADMTKKVLMSMARFIVSRSGSADDKRVYDFINAGNGYIDTLNDILALVEFGRNHKDLIPLVRPGGTAIDDAYLANAETEALRLLKLKGVATAAGDKGSVEVDRQNRLLTLCILALREIKLYAETAFFDDTERYNQYYASATRRAQYNKPAVEPADEVQTVA